MLTRIKRVTPQKADRIRSGEAVLVEIRYNAEHPGLRITASALTPNFVATLEDVAADRGEDNAATARLVVTREAGAPACECMVQFRIGSSRPFEVLFSVEGA